MNISAESVSAERLLVCAPGWIGDSIMSMPALQSLRERQPQAEIYLLVKPALQSLWHLHAEADHLISFDVSPGGTWRAVRELRTLHCAKAFILPNSFRSALIPALAGIPVRRGPAGHQRRLLMTDIVQPPDTLVHQSVEYAKILLPGDRPAQLPLPHLLVSHEAREKAAMALRHLPRPLVALLPGAARGPSKRWPPEHFRKLATHLRDTGHGLLFCGTGEESVLCNELAATVGSAALSMAGRCNFSDWAALLDASDAVVANDSGGMHLAAALGRPVVGLYGITDPRRTGPLGPSCAVLQAHEGPVSREIARNSRAAVAALHKLDPDRVFAALNRLLCGEDRVGLN